MNRIRRRTIAVLTKQGIDHELVLVPTDTLFDRTELQVWDVTLEQLKFLLEYFKPYRLYTVKVSRYGSACAAVNRDTIRLMEPDPLGSGRCQKFREYRDASAGGV